VNHMRWFFAWLGPHMGNPVRCADVFTVINMFEDILKGRCTRLLLEHIIDGGNANRASWRSFVCANSPGKLNGGRVG